MVTGGRTDAKAGGKIGGGSPFCSNEWDTGLSVTSFRAWAEPTHIVGLQLGFSDGSTGPMIGVKCKETDDKKRDPGAFSWADTDRIQSMRIWKNKAGDAVGRILIELASGTKYDVDGTTQGDGGKLLSRNNERNIS